MFVGIIVESTEIIIATDQGVIKARSFRRKVDVERWSKMYLASVRGVPWEPTPGSSDEQIRANFKPERETGPELAKESVVRESVSRGLYITKTDLKEDKYGVTPGCKGCIASNKGKPSTLHDDRCRARIEELIKEKEPDRY